MFDSDLDTTICDDTPTSGGFKYYVMDTSKRSYAYVLENMDKVALIFFGVHWLLSTFMFFVFVASHA